jgi:glutamine amidotransferase
MIAVIDITGNNLASLGNAITRLGYQFTLTHEPSIIANASHVILPGVGAAGEAMRALNHFQLTDVLTQISQPLLGICLGMQLLFEHSEEDNVNCLGLIPGYVQRLLAIQNHPVPHMGWNRLIWTKESPLTRGLNPQEHVYFVHSYAVFAENHALARCQYSKEFTAIAQHKNIYGMQFHPEKSAKMGLGLLNNFLKLEGRC